MNSYVVGDGDGSKIQVLVGHSEDLVYDFYGALSVADR